LPDLAKEGEKEKKQHRKKKGGRLKDRKKQGGRRKSKRAEGP